LQCLHDALLTDPNGELIAGKLTFLRSKIATIENLSRNKMRRRRTIEVYFEENYTRIVVNYKFIYRFRDEIEILKMSRRFRYFMFFLTLLIISKNDYRM